MGKFRHIVCQMTGTTDSAIAAFLLKRKGFHVTGLFVRSPYETKARQDFLQERAQYAARQLDITLENINLPQHHWQDLEKCAAVEYRAGRTPELQLMYEKCITFGAVKEYADKFLGSQLMATEHYARTSAPDDASLQTRLQGVHLFKGVDQYNDDSAVLAQIPQRSLRMTVLPLGEFTKDIVAHIARSSGLGSLVDDQIQGRHEVFIALRNSVLNDLPTNTGVFRNLETYETIGSHDGTHLWTVGQQIEIDNKNFWVAHTDWKTSDVMVVPKPDHLGLYADTLFTALAHWTFLTPYNFFEKHTMDCDFRLRAHDPVTRCQLTVGAHNEWCGNDHIILSSTQPIRCVSPGHLATFYRGEEAIGSATVLRPGPSHYAMYPEKRGSPAEKSGPGSSSPTSTYFFSPIRNFYQRLAAALSQS